VSTMSITSRHEIINTLIKKNGYTRYLEIGVRDNHCFDKVVCKLKHGVDPNGKGTYKQTSDEFFATIPAKQEYDVVFIDGLHLKAQVLRDVKNSLAHLSSNGALVLHDCSPLEAKHAIEDWPGHGTWNGTVWEAVAELRMTRTDLFITTVDVDYGCGIIKRGTQRLFETTLINFQLLEDRRVELLNLISADEFAVMFG
jgi:hypothetical protein